MLTRYSLAIVLLSLISIKVSAGTCPPDTAEYRLTFDSVWSAATHPTNFPSNPHFSGLIGGVHNDAVAFWALGETASLGIKRMAELGSKTVLTNEVNAAIVAGTAEAVISGGGIGVSPGAVSVDFVVSQDYPRATVVSMLAPSPDWFVGVAGQLLFINGNWIDQLVIDLYPYDAGTDSGSSYASANSVTNPAEPISLISGFPFLNQNDVASLGTFTFERLSATCSDSDGDGLGDDIDNCTLQANADQRDTDGDALGNICDPDIAPLANDCLVNFLDLEAMQAAFFSTPVSANWNPDADFNGDNTVSFVDLALMRQAFFLPPGPSAMGCH